MIKVLSIIPYKIFPAKVGGQKGIALFNEYLAKEVELVCVTVKSNDPAYAKPYRLLNVLTDSVLRYINPWNLITVKKIINSYKPTHLLLEHPYFGWLGVISKWITGIRLIVHSHNIESTRWKSLGKWWWKILWVYEKFTHRQADYSFFIHDDDRTYAIEQFGLSPSKCITLTYGIDWDCSPTKEERAAAKLFIRQKHNIAEETILLFNGAFNYYPNLDALQKIIDVIDPLIAAENFPYKILICGRDIPAAMSNRSYANIIFAGFVDDVSVYFKGADVFINPVTEGGGIKTKLVEALGNNMNAVSTRTGAIGVSPALTNQKLLISEDQDWPAFAASVKKVKEVNADIPRSYFEHFFWGYSVQKAVQFISP